VTAEQVGLGAAGAVALVALVVALLAHRRARRAEALAASLSERVAVPAAPAAQAPAAPGSDPAAFVITQVGGPREDDAPSAGSVPVARPIDGRLFTDIVARETVVRAAGWTHGLRRALSPETRNRIRFEVRQETRRAARGRRAEMKQALREFRARERAATRDEAPGSLGEDVA
jgi:hypothetical protein